MRHHLLTSVFFLATLMPLAGTSAAADRPTVEYSADSVIEHAEGAMKSRVYSTPTKERRDMTQEGMAMVTITRHDKKVMWTLMPEEKMYMEMKQGAQPSNKDDLSAYTIEQTVVGPETLNGLSVNKSKMIMTHSDGSKFGGFMWTTKEGILVKLDALSVEQGNKERFKIELSNLKIGKQDPALFEIPPGYETMPGMDMGSIMNMMK